jgi:SAM-dependent methyltransferase
MQTRIQRVGSMMLERYPIAYHAARPAYMAQALARRPYQIRKYLSSARDFTGLQIGAGTNQLPGWLKTDLNPDLKTVYMDAKKRFPFADCTFSYIVAEHVIEHIPHKDALNMLRECHRVLKNGGVARISTPSIELTHQLMHSPLTPVLERYVSWSNSTYAGAGAGNSDSAIHVVNRLQHEWGHQFLYDADTLAADLRQSGFAEVAECAPNKSGHPALTNVERHGETIGEEFNELESLIVEAAK